MRYVYIAGPYTRGDVIVNVRAAIEAADEVARAGFIPYLPHTTALWHLVCPHDVDFWYAYDLEWLQKCDALLRLPGDSTGADNEVAFAQEHEIPVFHRLHDLVSACVVVLPEPSEAPDD